MMKNVEFFEQSFSEGGKIAIFRELPSNTGSILNECVDKYIGHQACERFISRDTDNSFVQVIVFNTDSLPFKEYKYSEFGE